VLNLVELVEYPVAESHCFPVERRWWLVLGVAGVGAGLVLVLVFLFFFPCFWLC